MKRKIFRNTYKVLIPLDLTDDIKQAGEHAITEARERARLYCMPAQWEAKLVSKTGLDYIFRVTRFHY